ncbi:MAG: hypothetical protein KDI69_11410, partial [Xanthomonadales bacterium]|nr:hypothetical protein [Xanthomonadales bacterium]
MSVQQGESYADVITTSGIAATIGRVVIGAVLLLVPGTLAAAAVANPTLARFIRLDASQGLSQDSALAMAQDRHRFIWIGTQAGLNRFDGQQVKVFLADPGKPGGLLSSWVTSLAFDREQRLWVGTQRGLQRYIEHSDTFQRYPLSQDDANGDTVYTLYLDDEGGLWVGSDAGLSRYDPNTDSFTTYSITGEAAADFGPGQVRAISRRGDDVWLGTTAGLYRFRLSTQDFAAEPAFGTSAINAVRFDASGRLWVGTDQRGLFHWVPGSDPIAIALPHPRVHALYIDHDGDLWIGGELAAYRLRSSRREPPDIESYAHRPRDPFSPGRGRVPSFMEAADGSFWIGSWDGGASWTDPQFSRVNSLTTDNDGLLPLRDPRVLAVAAEDKAFWLGTGDGVAHYDPVSGQIEPLNATQGLLVFTLLATPDALWIGTDLGIYRYDRQTGQLDKQHFHPELENVRIRRMMIDGDRLWVFAELVGLHVVSLQRGESIARHRFVGNVYFIDLLDETRVLATASDGLHWFQR